MGDPFSIATGVAGLVSLGITVCDGLHTYFSAIKDRKDDLAIVTQNVAVFKFQISAVQFSASKLGHRHSPAIDGLQLSLINCEMQLKCLETLLNELLPTEDPSLAKNIWRKQKLIARYPFDRKKLVQLEEYLSRANSTLSSFIQALNLDINIRMSDKLETFRKSIEARDINTQTSEGVAATKTCFPGIELSFQDLRNTHSTPRYLQNAELERRLCEKLADMDCSCGASNIKISKRPASRTYRFWGGLTVSRQGDVRANHRPGCIFFQRSKRNISRTSATYFGLLSFFSQCFTISLTQEYPGGPYGVSFGLQTCNIIESSPAFRFFDIGSRGFYKFFNNNKDKPSLSQTAETFIKELRLIYRSEKVSPFDVDHDGNNVAHMFLDACQGYFTFEESLKLSDTELDAICKILAYLADIGVPITASNFNQLNVLTLAMSSCGNIRILPRLYRLVTNCNSSFCLGELLARNELLITSTWLPGGERWASQLNSLCQYPEICEDIGFSDLFLAVMRRDHTRLQAILSQEDDISNVSQMDLYKLNILHVSSNWPDGLRLLLQRQDVRPLMDMASIPFPIPSPLDCALFCSNILCNAPDQWTECNNCTCYTAVQLLLEADCRVTITDRLHETLTSCSLKARKLFFKHLQDRRQRLRIVALSTLPEKVLRQYGVTTSSLPDKTAVPLWRELQRTQYQQDRRVWLPDSLDPCDRTYSIPKSLFEFPHHLQVAELALDYGFAPRDEKGVQTLLSSLIIPHHLPSHPEAFMKYLDWLLRHDLNLKLSLQPFRLSFLHRISCFIGKVISLNTFPTSNIWRTNVYISELQDSSTLLPALCDNRSQCNIPCPCTSGMFTRPLAHIFPAMLRDRCDSQFSSFFSHIKNHIVLVANCIDLLKLSECSSGYLYMAKCAIHILTMMSLGVRHLPICPTQDYDNLKYSMAKEDWKEVLDEDRELIDQLEALDQEFGVIFDRQSVSIADFLLGFWLTRMEEVIRNLSKPLSDDDKYNLLEAGVVLDEDTTDGSECSVEYIEDVIVV